MSFPRYPAYKDSGVEWLGDVPEHWTIIQSRRMFRARREAAREGDVMLTASQKYGMIPQAEFVEREGRRVVEVIHGKDNLIHVEPDDFVISMRSFQGGLEWCHHSGSTSFHYVPVTPIKFVVPAFFAHLLKSERYISALRSTTNLIRDGQEIRYSNFVQVPLPVIPESEQLAIATFLDHETAKIDALIAEQQRLIELLQEKRQAVISHAVTKGLNPDAPMKDSGVEWLGEVPEHWTLKRLKHLSPKLTVGIVVNPSEYVSDEGLPFIYGGDIREGVIDWDNSRRIAPALSDKQAKTRLRSGDLLMVRVGAPGITAVVPAECEGGNCASVMLIRQGSFSSQWLCFTLNTRIVRFQVEVVQYGAAQEQFNISHAVNFWLPVPPRQEQDRIATFLLSEHEKAQGLILQAQNAVSLLQERRSALISAAVTGQIDVRGLVTEGSDA